MEIYENIICKDECFLCKINWDGEREIEIYNCDINVCERHNQEIMKPFYTDRDKKFHPYHTYIYCKEG